MNSIPNNLPAFTARRVGTNAFELLDADGQVIGWTVDSFWAGLIVSLLNRVEEEGLGKMLGPHSYIEGHATPETQSTSEARRQLGVAFSDAGPLFY